MIRLSDVLVFLLISVGVSILSKKTNISPVLGFLISGILAGPYLGDYITSTETIDFFSHLGIIFLLFTIGLHLPLDKIKNIQRYIFGFGSLQMILTTGLYSITLSTFFDVHGVSNIVLSFIVSLSSTALILKVLEDSSSLATSYGKASFGTLLFQDFAAIAAITLLPIASNSGDTSIINAMVALLKPVIALSGIVVSARFLLKPVYKWAVKNGSQVFMSITLISVFGIASLTNYFGISTELGAFLAGILMAGSDYRLQIEADIAPFKELLMGLFFITVGTDINFEMLSFNKMLIFQIVISIFVVKAFVIFVVSKLFKHSITSGIKSAFLMAGGGEFSFVMFVAIGDTNLIANDKLQFFSLAISITMALTPLLAFLGKVIAEWIEMRILVKIAPESISKPQNLTDHVIIAGFGRVGETIANLLAQHLIPYVAIDSDIQRVVRARAKGLPVYYGDAKRREVYRILDVYHAKIAVIALGKPLNSEKAGSMLIQNFPKLEIWMRLNESERAMSLEQSGLNIVVPELFEPSLQLAKAVLKASGINPDDADQTISKYREKYKIKNISSIVEEIKQYTK